MVRPSIKLDHDDPETLKLPHEHRMEYRYVSEWETTEHIDERAIVQHDQRKPLDTKAEAEAAAVARNADIVQNAMKSLRVFKNQRDEIESRVTSFSCNEYLGLTRP